MNKLTTGLLIGVLLALFALPVFAQTGNVTVTNNGAPEETMAVPGDEVLVMDFTLTVGNADIMVNDHDGNTNAKAGDDVITTFPDDLKFWDTDGNGYDPGDELYLDDDGDGVYTKAADAPIDNDGTATQTPSSTITANDGESAGDPLVQFVSSDNVFFQDTDSNGAWDTGECIFLDEDADTLLDAGEQILNSGNTGNPGTNAAGTNLVYFDANENGAYDDGEDIFDSSDSRMTYSAAGDTQINAGQDDSFDAPDGATLQQLTNTSGGYTALGLVDVDDSSSITEGDEVIDDIGGTAGSYDGGTDTLNAITFKNQGNAVDTTDIASVEVYVDDGDGVWDGEPALGTATWATDSWDLNPTTGQEITGAGTRFFVTATIAADATLENTIQLYIPAFNDADADNTFDPTDDEGIFLGSGQDLPDSDVVNPDVQTIGAPVVNTTQNKGYTTIQAAIDDAAANDVIEVSDGTYEEELTIEVNGLELKSASSPILKGTEVDDTGVYFGLPNISILADGVKLHGFTIESPDTADGETSAMIFLDGENIEIYDNDFVAIGAGSSGKSGDAQIWLIQTYRKGVSPVAPADIDGLSIHDNTFTGTVPDGYCGIYVNPDKAPDDCGVVQIKDNDFTGDIFQGVVVERSNVLIQGNTMITDRSSTADYGVGIALGYWTVSDFPTSQKHIDVSGNTIKGAGVGLGFDRAVLVGFRSANGTSSDENDINVVNNVIGGSGNAIGIQVKALATGSEGVNVNYNQFLDNTAGLDATSATIDVDATYNWWGSTAGPTHANNADGDGDTVSDNVAYRPWLNGVPTADYADNTIQGGKTVQNVDDSEFFWTIQDALDATNFTAGDTIEVANGTYSNEHTATSGESVLVEITQPVTLRAKDGHTPLLEDSGDGEPVDNAIEIHASDVTIQGFEIAEEETGGIVTGIFLNNSAGMTGISILDNYIHDLSAAEGDHPQFNQAIYSYSSPGDTLGIVIDGNVIDSIGDSTDAEPFGMGIFLRQVEDATITGNVFSNIYDGDYSSTTYHGIGVALEMASSSAAVTGNIFGKTESGDWGDVHTAIAVGGNVIGVQINDNAFYHDPAASGVTVGVDAVNYTDTLGAIINGPVDATENYWGDATGPHHASTNPSGQGAEVTNDVDYSPWLMSWPDGPLASAYDTATNTFYRGYHDGYYDGWQLLSIPLQAADSSPTAVFDELGTLIIYQYDECQSPSQYIGRTTDPELTEVNPTGGYWVYFMGDEAITVEGATIQDQVTVTLGCAGWQMISVPTVPVPITHNETENPGAPDIMFSTDGIEWKNYADARAAGWLDATAPVWLYNNSTGEYGGVGPYGILDPWTGYWLKTAVDNLLMRVTVDYWLTHAPAPPNGAESYLPKSLGEAQMPPAPPTMPKNLAAAMDRSGLVVYNEPNPIRDVHTTTFKVKSALPIDAVRVEIFNQAGQLVFSEEQVGSELTWHTDNDYGEFLANGVYLYRVSAKINGSWVVTEVRKLAIIR